MNLASIKKPVAARPRLRALLRLPRRRDEPVVSRPRLRQPSGRAADAAGGGLPPHRSTSPTRRSSFIRDAKAIAPDKPFFLYYCPGAVPRAAPRAEGVGRQVQGQVRHGLRGLPRARVRAPEEARDRVPDQAELSPINPYVDEKSPDGQGLAGARHRPALGLALRRREAAVLPHGRGLRRLPQPRRPRDRPAARLPRGDRGSSTTR